MEIRIPVYKFQDARSEMACRWIMRDIAKKAGFDLDGGQAFDWYCDRARNEVVIIPSRLEVH